MGPADMRRAAAGRAVAGCAVASRAAAGRAAGDRAASVDLKSTSDDNLRPQVRGKSLVF